MNYKDARTTINALNDLLLKIEEKQREVEVSNEYNLKNSISALEIDVQKIIDEKTEMEYQFRELTLKLRS